MMGERLKEKEIRLLRLRRPTAEEEEAGGRKEPQQELIKLTEGLKLVNVKQNEGEGEMVQEEEALSNQTNYITKRFRRSVKALHVHIHDTSPPH